MKKFLKTFSFILAIINTVAFISLRQCWSGISSTLGYKTGKPIILYYVPVIVFVLFLAVAISEFIAIKRDKGNRYPMVYTIIEIVFCLIIAAVVMFGGLKYVRFAVVNFAETMLVVLAVAFLYWLLFAYPKSSKAKSKGFKVFVICAVVAVSIVILVGSKVNIMLYEPVVYAVEDEYQIVFSGSAKSIGTVTVDGVEYYDLYNGSEKSADRVHKVCVPMEVLDKAGKYTVSMQSVIYRGPFGGFLGKTKSKEYNFRPVDTSDGFKYLAFSDIHANRKGTVKTASNTSDIDLLVINGDTLSMIDRFWDANFVNRVAFDITKGEYPVIYARGNHEIKGAYAEQFYKYVGSKNGEFYYSVKLADVYALVLDIGEDHDDDWWEYYTTAHFDDYRKAQTEFLQKEKESGEYLESSYNMVICHIPIVYVNARHNHEAIKAELTDILNSMNIDMNLCAHQHELLIFEPGKVTPNEKLTYNPKYAEGTYKGYLTDFFFSSLMVSKPGYVQSEDDENEASHIGLVVEADFNNKTQTCYYLNANGEHVSVVNPFADIDYGTQIDFAIH